MSVALLVMTDGRRDYLTQTLERFDEIVTGAITCRVIHDDSGDPLYRQWLRDTFPAYDVIGTPARSGFAGAMQSAWRHAEHLAERYILHLEDDFLFTRPVDLTEPASMLDSRPYLAQLAFRRQPWGAEVKHGGFMAMAPDLYTEHTDGERSWVETTRNYTTNPSLHRRELCTTAWPDGEHTEGRYGFQLREHGLPWGVAGEDVRFGFWGSMDAGRDWVWHIGETRAGTGY